MTLRVSTVYIAPLPGILPINCCVFELAIGDEPTIYLRFDDRHKAELARLEWLCKAGAFMPFAQVCTEQKAADSAAEVKQ